MEVDGSQIVRGALLSWQCMALSLEWASGHEEVSGYEPLEEREKGAVAAIQSVTPLSVKKSKV